MSTIVSATVAPAEFALRDTFDETPAVECETMRVAAHDTRQPMPFLWVTAPDQDTADTALRADDTTGTVEVLCRSDGQRLYRIDWQSRIRSLLRALVGDHGTLLEASARAERWEFRLLFPDHDRASRMYERYRDRGIDLEVRRVTDDTDGMADGENPLSNEQQEALVTAFETDYYRVPRGITQKELAEQMGVSHQALSERLRRGHLGLISDTLCPGSET